MALAPNIGPPQQPPSVSLSRQVASARNVATVSDAPIETVQSIPPPTTQATGPDQDRRGNSGDRERPRQEPGVARLRTPSAAFAAVFSVERADESAALPGTPEPIGPRPFSGLVIRVLTLYETTAKIVSGSPPTRGATFNFTN